MTGKVAGSRLIYARMLDDVGAVLGGGDGWCTAADWLTCPGRVTLRGDYVAPSTPGDYVIRIIGQESKDASPRTITRVLHVQPASYLTTRVSSRYVRTGATVTVSGRLRRVDTGTGVRGIPVTLQWRAAGSTKWRDQATITSDRRGRVTTTSAHRVTGWYRWATAGVRGRIGPSKGIAVRVQAYAG